MGTRMSGRAVIIVKCSWEDLEKARMALLKAGLGNCREILSGKTPQFELPEGSIATQKFLKSKFYDETTGFIKVNS